ncbi:MAG: EamA family transporter [Lentimicrobium sp.]|nr:EamA family transporter [Lentimicrobium sp.]
MLYLILAITASTLILICFKLFGKFGIDDFSAITINYIVGSLFGFNFINWEQNISAIAMSSWFPMALLTGGLLISGFVLFSISTRKAGVAITAISSRMSVVIPVLLGLVFLGDEAGVLKISGIVLALVALYLTLKKDNKEKVSLKFIWIPLSVFMFMGLNDSTVKVTQHFFLSGKGSGDYVSYAATAFMVAFFIGLIISLFRISKGVKVFKIKNLLGGMILGILNWFSMYYLLKGFEVIQVSVFVPLVNISVVALSSIIGYLIFKEKLRPLNWIGILFALIAILMIAA